MLTIKRSAGVAPEMNLRSPFQGGGKAQRQQKPKQGVSIAPQTGLMSSKKILKRKQIQYYLHPNCCGTEFSNLSGNSQNFFIVDEFFFADTITRHLDTFHHGYHSTHIEPSHLELFHPYLLPEQIGADFIPTNASASLSSIFSFRFCFLSVI